MDCSTVTSSKTMYNIVKPIIVVVYLLHVLYYTRLYAALPRAALPRHDAALPHVGSLCRVARSKLLALVHGKPRSLARKAASPCTALPRHTDAGTYVPRLI